MHSKYTLNKSQEKINHLLYMHDNKLFSKNEKELETLIQIMRIYIQDIGMEFDIEKCAKQIMKSRKRHITEGIELPNQEKIRTFRSKESNKYLGIFEADTIKQVEWKKKSKNSISGESESYSRQKYILYNLIKGVNTGDVLFVIYSGPILKWTRKDLKQRDRRTKINDHV